MKDVRPARDQQQLLLDWAGRVFRDEGPQLTPRVATVRGSEVEGIAVDRSFGLRGLAQAASVVARGVGDGDLVMALSPGRGRLESTEWGAVADLRSRAGRRTLRMLGARPKAGGVAYWQRELPGEMVAHLGEWVDRGYDVEPWVEVEVARRGIGATASAMQLVRAG